MSEAEHDLLADLFAAEAAPARDPAFTAETLRRVSRRRLVLDILAGVPWMVAAVAVLWALHPAVESIARVFYPDSASWAPLAPAVAILLGLYFILTGLAGSHGQRAPTTVR
jgi:hypothetical protein